MPPDGASSASVRRSNARLPATLRDVATPAPLRTALNSIQQKMLIDFEGVTGEISHEGMRGREREAMIVNHCLFRPEPDSVGCAVESGNPLSATL
jgi:hypothetical protein